MSQPLTGLHVSTWPCQSVSLEGNINYCSHSESDGHDGQKVSEGHRSDACKPNRKCIKTDMDRSKTSRWHRPKKSDLAGKCIAIVMKDCVKRGNMISCTYNNYVHKLLMVMMLQMC